MPLWVDSPVLCEYLSSRSQAAGCQLGVAPVGLVIPSCTGGGAGGVDSAPEGPHPSPREMVPVPAPTGPCPRGGRQRGSLVW